MYIFRCHMNDVCHVGQNNRHHKSAVTDRWNQIENYQRQSSLVAPSYMSIWLVYKPPTAQHRSTIGHSVDEIPSSGFLWNNILAPLMPQCHGWITLVSRYPTSQGFDRFEIFCPASDWPKLVWLCELCDYVRVCDSHNTHTETHSYIQISAELKYGLIAKWIMSSCPHILFADREPDRTNTLFWLCQLLQKAVSLRSGSLWKPLCLLCFLLAEPWFCDLYQTVCRVHIVHSICKVVTCCSYMHEPVSTSNVNLFMVSRKADGGLRRTEDLSESSFCPSLLPPLSFSHCVSVSVLPP